MHCALMMLVMAAPAALPALRRVRVAWLTSAAAGLVLVSLVAWSAPSAAAVVRAICG